MSPSCLVFGRISTPYDVTATVRDRRDGEDWGHEQHRVLLSPSPQLVSDGPRRRPHDHLGRDGMQPGHPNDVAAQAGPGPLPARFGPGAGRLRRIPVPHLWVAGPRALREAAARGRTE